jgi:CheY-like chemotaxis protein
MGFKHINNGKVNSDLVRLTAAAESTCSSVEEISAWIRKGLLKSYKLPDGGEVVHLSEVGACILAHSSETTDPDIGQVSGDGSSEGRETVLIVDDDAMVRGMIAQILSPLYSVHQAQNGFEAIRMIQKSDIRLVLLDIRMPGQSGVETYEQIKQIRPNMAVLIVSGYIEDVPDSMMADSAVRGIIEKPVGEEVLLDTVASALAGADII